MKLLPFNPQITVGQHFVPSHFLNAWCDNDLLWVSNRNAKLFQQKPDNVAKAKGIYSLDFMTADEFMLNFSSLASLYNRLNPELLRTIMDTMVTNLLYKEIIDGKLSQYDFNRIISFIVETNLCSKLQIELLKFIWAIHEKGAASEEVKRFCDKQFIEGMEPFATTVEQLAYPLIERLRGGDFSFVSDYDEREKILLYIALQIYRVRKFIDIAAYYGTINSKTLKLSRILLIARTWGFLLENWDKEEFCIVDNDTDLEFVTGDNPLSNLDAHDRSKHLDLFFPISPRKAIFLCSKDRMSIYPEVNRMTTQYVHELNQKISAGCTYQVFAASRETLEAGKYKPSFDPKKAATRYV